jgi:SWI/SNF-related matrix-associated actin-dependent regulator 1 of chromatin subfamily A
VILSGGGSFRWPAPGDLVVTSYNLLPEVREQHVRNHSFPTLPPNPPQGLSAIFDEAHYLKTPDSQRTRAAIAVAETAFSSQGRVWELTGTPLLNEPPELYTLLSVAGLAVEAFGRYSQFVELFHGKRIPMGKMGLYKTVWGAPDESVPKRLARVMLRRLKKDVLPQLPEKFVEVLEVEVDPDYMRELDKIAFSLMSEDGLPITDPMAIYEATRESRVVFERVASLRKLVALAKIPAALAFADEMEAEGEKLVVMSAHVEPIRSFKKRKGWEVIEGSTLAHQRTEIEEAFQRGELSGIACSIKAAGVALTLTRAARMLFIDESWTPSENLQAEDRLCRLGQTRGVIVTRLFCDHELDKHVLRVLHRKEVLISRVVDAAARREA